MDAEVLELAIKAKKNDLATAYSIVECDDGWRIVWWTNDNADVGYPSGESGEVHKVPTIADAYKLVRSIRAMDKFASKQKVTHSWDDHRGRRVGVFVNGELLPFVRPFVRRRW